MCEISLGLPVAAIEPVPESSVSTVEERTQEERERWWKMGLKAISDGKLAVLLLSGGQVFLRSVFSFLRCYNVEENMMPFGIILLLFFDESRMLLGLIKVLVILSVCLPLLR